MEYVVKGATAWGLFHLINHWNGIQVFDCDLTGRLVDDCYVFVVFGNDVMSWECLQKIVFDLTVRCLFNFLTAGLGMDIYVRLWRVASAGFIMKMWKKLITVSSWISFM